MRVRIVVTFRKITASIATSNVYGIYRTFAHQFYFHSSFDMAFLKAKMCIPRNFQLMCAWNTAGFVDCQLKMTAQAYVACVPF